MTDAAEVVEPNSSSSDSSTVCGATGVTDSAEEPSSSSSGAFTVCGATGVTDAAGSKVADVSDDENYVAEDLDIFRVERGH